jgi:hypothetical protein
VDVLDETSPSDDARPLTPGEVLCELFMRNADRGCNAANDELVAQLQRRVRALAQPPDEP